MQMIVSDLWNSNKANNLDLIHPYDLNLNSDEIASEMRSINSTLSEAIAHDISRNGEAEVEQIDRDNNSSDASDTAKMILVASLSTTGAAIQGLREHQLIEGLQRPGRDLSSFKSSVLDKLCLRAWYLHNSADGRLFFKNQQNLTAKLRSESLALHQQTVDSMLKDRLLISFEPSLKDCFQLVKVLSPLDEVNVEQEKTVLIIVKPGSQFNQLPISEDWQNWWSQQQYKNRVLFLSGSRDTFQKVLDSARQSRALQSIEEELRSEALPADDPQWRTLDEMRDRIELQFMAALKEAFDQIVYPSINNSLRSTGLELAFAENNNAEAIVKQTLQSVQKFTVNLDVESLRAKAESRLFGSADTQMVLWSDFKRNAAVQTTWPLHKVSALDELRQECLRRDLWREEGNYIRRGPFPPPDPKVVYRELSREEDGDGSTFLKIEALHAQALVYESGDTDPTPASTPVPTPLRFEAKGLRYNFLAYDPENPERVSEVKEWSAPLRVKHKLLNRGDHYEIELAAYPKSNAIKIRYTTDGTSPDSLTATTYDTDTKIPEDCRVVMAVAQAELFGLQSEPIRIPIPKRGETPQLNQNQPARWNKQHKFDESGRVWNFIDTLANADAVKVFDINLTAQNKDGSQLIDFNGSLTEGYNAELLKEIAESLQTLVGADSLRLSLGSLGFPTGQALLDWVQNTKQAYDFSEVVQ